MTIAHLGVAIVAGYVGKDWKGHTFEGNICAGLICTPPPGAVPVIPSASLTAFFLLIIAFPSSGLTVDLFTLFYGVSWGPIAWT